MGHFIGIDGKIVPQSRAVLPVTDSSYLYGIGLFETMRVMAGRVLLLQRHFRRLQDNANLIGLKVPVSLHDFKKWIHALLRKNRLRDSQVRVMLSEAEVSKSRLVMTANPFQSYPERCYTQGARVMYSKSFSADSKTLSRIKTTSYLSKMIPRREAARRNMDEALMVNESGYVTEGASSNLFIVTKGVLITPPISDGLLPGTRRRFVMELAKSLKIPVVEKSLCAAALNHADEIFITSSLKDIMPVGWIERKKAGNARIVTGLLQKAYRTKLQPPEA